jgi:biuret amidohydrolase
VQHNRNLPIPDTLADVCDPDRMALVVYDMQVVSSASSPTVSR